jgi:hypothetical protein
VIELDRNESHEGRKLWEEEMEREMEKIMKK